MQFFDVLENADKTEFSTWPLDGQVSVVCCLLMYNLKAVETGAQEPFLSKTNVDRLARFR